MRGLRKRWAASVLLCMTLCLAGCGEEKIIPEDFKQANCQNIHMNAIARTDKGFYYSQNALGTLGLHYYDVVNGKSMYLCNKPECRHDGDEFCVATSYDYQVLETVLYSGSLYINAYEYTETGYEYKLLCASLDGSSLSEVVTYFAVDNVNAEPFVPRDNPRCMTIHRNKVFLPYSLQNVDNKEVGYTGTAIYDMDTKEVTYLGEKEQDFSVKNCRYLGYGDYMYYVAAQKYKNELYRYSYADGSVEKMELERGFRGDYTVVDDNTIFYRKMETDLCIYHPDTKENIVLDSKEWTGIVTYFDDHSEAQPHFSITHCGFSDVITDGEYVYVSENYSFRDYGGPSIYGIIHPDCEEIDFAEIDVFDKEGNFLRGFRLNTEELLGYNDYFTLHFVEDSVYMQTPAMVFECSKDSFIAGEPKFQEVYPMDIHIMTRKKVEE